MPTRETQFTINLREAICLSNSRLVVPVQTVDATPSNQAALRPKRIRQDAGVGGAGMAYVGKHFDSLTTEGAMGCRGLP